MTLIRRLRQHKKVRKTMRFCIVFCFPFIRSSLVLFFLLFPIHYSYMVMENGVQSICYQRLSSFSFLFFSFLFCRERDLIHMNTPRKRFFYPIHHSIHWRTRVKALWSSTEKRYSKNSYQMIQFPTSSRVNKRARCIGAG